MLKRASLYTILACTACCSAAFAIQPTIRAGSLSINSGIKPSTVSLTPVTTTSSSSSSGVSTTNSRLAISSPLQKKNSKYSVTANTSTTASETAAALAELRQAISDLSTQQTTMEDSLVQTVQSHINELDFTENTSLNNKLTGLQNQNTTLSTKVTGLTSDVSNLTNDLADVNSDVSTLTSTVTGITGDISTLATADQLDAVSRDLNTVTSNVAALTPEKIARDIANSSSARTTLSDKMLKNSSGEMLFATKTEIEADALADKLSTVFATKDLDNVNPLTNTAIRSAVLNTLEEKEILDSSGELAITGTIDETALNTKLSAYPTKTEIESTYAPKTAVATSALKEALKGEFAAKSLESTVATLQTGGDVDLTGYVKTEDLEDYATKDLSNVTANNTKIVNTVIDTLKGKRILDNAGELAIGGIDDDELAGKLKGYAKTEDIAETYAAKSEVSDLQDQVAILQATGTGSGSVDLKEYAKKSEIESEYAPLSSLATANESISSLRADLAKATGGIETKDSILNKIANDDELKRELKGKDGDNGETYTPVLSDKGILNFRRSDGTMLSQFGWSVKGDKGEQGEPGESGKSFNLKGNVSSYSYLTTHYTCNESALSDAYYNENENDGDYSNKLFVCSNTDSGWAWVGIKMQRGAPGRNAKTVEQSYCENNYSKVKALFSDRSWTDNTETDCANTSLFSYADYSAVTGGAGAYCLYLAEQIGNGKMAFDAGSVGKKISTMFGTSVNKNKTLEQLKSTGTENVLSATFAINNINIKFMQACEAKYNEIMNPKTVEQTYCEENFAKVHALYPSKVQKIADCADPTIFTPADYTAMIGGATAYCLHIAETAGNMNLNDGIGKKLSGIFSTEAMTAFRNANTLESRLAVREFKVSKDATEKVTFMTACEARYNDIMNPETPWHAYCVSQAEGYPEGTTNETAIVQPLFNKNCDTFTNDDWNAIQGGAKAYCLYIAKQAKKTPGVLRASDLGKRLERVLPGAITAVSQNGLSARISVNNVQTPFMEACETKYNEIMNPETPWLAYCTAQNDIITEKTNLEVIITPLFPTITKCEDFTSDDYNAINGGAKAYCTYIAKQAQNDTLGTFEASDTGKSLKRVFGDDVISNLKATKNTKTLNISLKFGGSTTNMNFISACETKYNEIMNPETPWHAYCESVDENATEVNGVKPKKLVTIIQPLYNGVTDCSKFTSDQYNALQGGAKAYCMYISKTLKDYSKNGTLANFKKTATGKKLVKVLSEDLINTAATGNSISQTFMNECETKYNDIMAGQNGEDAKSVEQTYCEEHYDIVKQLFAEKTWTDDIETDCANKSLFSFDDYTAVTSGDTAYCLYISKLVKGKTNAEVTTFEATDTGRKLKKLFGRDVLGKLQSSGISATVTINNREMTFLEGCKKKYNEIMAGENAKTVEQTYCEEHYDIVKQLFNDKRWSSASTITDEIKESDCATLFSSEDYAAITAGSRSYCLYLLKNMTASFDLDTGIGKKLAKTFGAEKMETLKGKGTLAARMSVGGFKVDSKNSDGTFMQACEARYDEIMSGEDGTDAKSVEQSYCEEHYSVVQKLFNSRAWTGNAETDCAKTSLFSFEDYTAVTSGARAYCLYLTKELTDGKLTFTSGIGKKLADKLDGGSTSKLASFSGQSVATVLDKGSDTYKFGGNTFVDACESNYNEIMNGENGAPGEDAVDAWCKAHTIISAGGTATRALPVSKRVRAKAVVSSIQFSTVNTEKFFKTLQECKDAVAADPDIMGGASASDEEMDNDPEVTESNFATRKANYIAGLKPFEPEIISGNKIRYKRKKADGTYEYLNNNSAGTKFIGEDGQQGPKGNDGLTFEPIYNEATGYIQFRKAGTTNEYFNNNSTGFKIRGNDGKVVVPTGFTPAGRLAFAEANSGEVDLSAGLDFADAVRTSLMVGSGGQMDSTKAAAGADSLEKAIRAIAAEVAMNVSAEVSSQIAAGVSDTRTKLLLNSVKGNIAAPSSPTVEVVGGTEVCGNSEGDLNGIIGRSGSLRRTGSFYDKGDGSGQVCTMTGGTEQVTISGRTTDFFDNVPSGVTLANFDTEGGYVSNLKNSVKASIAPTSNGVMERTTLDTLAGVTRSTSVSCSSSEYNNFGVCAPCGTGAHQKSGQPTTCVCTNSLETWTAGVGCRCTGSNVYSNNGTCTSKPNHSTVASDGQSFICDAGYTKSSNSCTACAKGTYKSNAGNEACTACPSGQYQDQTGKTSCKTCSSGQPNASATGCTTPSCSGLSINGSCITTASGCQATADVWWDTSAQRCKVCGDGGYRSAGSSSYTQCQCDDKYSWNSSQGMCVENAQSDECSKDTSGTYNIGGKDVCIECDSVEGAEPDKKGACSCKKEGYDFVCTGTSEKPSCKCQISGASGGSCKKPTDVWTAKQGCVSCGTVAGAAEMTVGKNKICACTLDNYYINTGGDKPVCAQCPDEGEEGAPQYNPETRTCVCKTEGFAFDPTTGKCTKNK